ncbi:hypothetical protein [Candidatus Aalborgicola defluviihabitans]|uniref:hypothetical protein n=1 Tax=Candidatus Aalborgicola defluviihabitans TaxID=3386187 RepID=UPI00390A24B1|nr:hypothetical protein [Burkholderiales bacterium]
MPRSLGVSLAALGTLLLALRLFDAVLDPPLVTGWTGWQRAVCTVAGRWSVPVCCWRWPLRRCFIHQVAAADALAWAGYRWHC